MSFSASTYLNSVGDILQWNLHLLFCFFSECPTGKFGFACQRTCHCADHSKCSKENGTCSGGKCEKDTQVEIAKQVRKLNL